MAEHYVDHAVGNDGNAGHAEGAGNAWKTVQKAVDNTVAGDRINIKAVGGDYVWDEIDQEDHGANQCLAIDTGGDLAAGTWKVLEGYTTTIGDGGMVVFDANNDTKPMTRISNVKNVCCRNITFSNVSHNAPGTNSAVYILDNGPGVFVKNILFINCVFTDSRHGVNSSTEPRGIYFIDCVFHDVEATGMLITGGSVFIYNCVAYNCGSQGFRFARNVGACINSIAYNCGSLFAGDAGIIADTGEAYVLAVGDTVYSQNSVGIKTNNAASVILAINAIVSDSGSENFIQSAGTLSGLYTCSYNGGAADDFTLWGGNVTDNPRFGNPGSDDFTPYNSDIIYGGMADVYDVAQPMGAIHAGRRYSPHPQETLPGAPITGSF